MSDQVDIVHAESGGEATVSRHQYDQVWHGRGWRLADGSDTQVDTPEPTAEDDEDAADPAAEQPPADDASQRTPKASRSKRSNDPRSA